MKHAIHNMAKDGLPLLIYTESGRKYHVPPETKLVVEENFNISIPQDQRTHFKVEPEGEGL